MNAVVTLERSSLPASLDAEKSVLGGILLDNALYHEATTRLTPDEFSLDGHRRIFTRIRDLRESGRVVDMITLAEELDRHKEIETVGGVAYLSSLIDGVPDRPSIASYVEIVKDKAVLRRLLNIAQNTITEAIERSAEPRDVLGRTERALLKLSEDAAAGEKPLVSLAHATPEAYNALFKQQEQGLTFGIPELDAKTHGICPEDFVIIGGDPGSGKSAQAGQIAAENGRAGKRVGIWSIEMRRNRCMRRMWCYESGLFYDKLRQSPEHLSPEDRADFEEAVRTVAEWPVSINDASSLTPHAFISQARHAVLRDRMELAILDHVQIMTEAMSGRDDIDKIKLIAGTLRQFAKDYCPVVALSQLTRQSKEQRSNRPVMSDLYGGRFLEMNASIILMSWIPERDGEPTHEDELILVKNREGGTANVPVLFRKPLMRFVSRQTGQ
jgi:replicative DNA helicase